MSTCFGCWSCCCSFSMHKSSSSMSGTDNVCANSQATTRKDSTSHAINESEVDLSHFSSPLEILGIGGFGLVRKATKLSQLDAGTQYAIKSTTKTSILSRSTGLQAMMSELKSLIVCTGCEYICQLHYAFQDASHVYFVLDYALGGDMRYNMRRSPGFRLSENLARLFIKQVFLALHYCHQHSVLHRDIKPENILLQATGKVALSDFGVAKLLPDVETCRSTSGTHGYMAPEVYARNHVHGTAFDWFATGITLFEFITGRRPFEASRLQRYHLLKPESEVDGMAVAPLPSSTTRQRSAPSLCGLLQSDDSCDDSLTVEDLRITAQVTPECQDFIEQLLKPNPHERLGNNGNFDQILSHPWMQNPLAVLHPYPLGYVCNQLPHLEAALRSQSQEHRGANGGLVRDLSNGGQHPLAIDQIFSKVNMSQGDAQVAVRTHLLAGAIPGESQCHFKNFEYNTCISHSSADSLSTHSLAMCASSSMSQTTAELQSSPESCTQPQLRRSTRNSPFKGKRGRLRNSDEEMGYIASK